MDGSGVRCLLLLLTSDHHPLADHRDIGCGVNQRRDVKLASSVIRPQSAPAATKRGASGSRPLPMLILCIISGLQWQKIDGLRPPQQCNWGPLARCFSSAKLPVTIQSRARHDTEALERIHGEASGHEICSRALVCTGAQKSILKLHPLARGFPASRSGRKIHSLQYRRQQGSTDRRGAL